MKRRITSILLMLIMAVSVALSGCSGDKAKPESATENELPKSKNPVEGGSIKVGISQDLDSLDPHR
ncbi:MAG: ABC transporter substrate-binding protein, partial [Ruminococcus sp.]|nr:ABC transporter substrate-binding protein [Ruminococcus sp.]